jgi:hypothetical protein
VARDLRRGGSRRGEEGHPLLWSPLRRRDVISAVSASSPPSRSPLLSTVVLIERIHGLPGKSPAEGLSRCHCSLCLCFVSSNFEEIYVKFEESTEASS